MADDGGYALGHDRAELDRLKIQATLFRPFTRRLLSRAGVRPGMNILDLGCGAGDFSLLLRELVGPLGFVVGMDRSPAAIEEARARAEAAGHDNMSFRIGDENDLVNGSDFDAVFCRYVLMHQHDPVAFVRTAARGLRPGGLFIAEEMAMAVGSSTKPEVRLWSDMFSSLVAFGQATFPSSDVAQRLIPVLRSAGLLASDAIGDVNVADADSAYVGWAVDSYLVLQPRMAERGVTYTPLGNPSTLRDRIRSALRQVDAQILGCPEVGAWGIKR